MRKAFSLVELSIVLVILGLLAGGILAGQSLIRASELRSVGTQINNYRTAMYAFRDKYMGLPGDFSSATRFWGDQATGTSSCADATITDGTPGTCNGNGDGDIHGYLTEGLRAWQHLAMAGLIEGSYTGYTNTSPVQLIGINVPASKISGVGFSIARADNVNFADGGPNDWGSQSWGNVMFVGLNNTDAYRANAFRPEELWNLDTKLDDGKPAYGWIISERWRTCNTTSVASTAEYALTNSNVICAIRTMLK